MPVKVFLTLLICIGLSIHHLLGQNLVLDGSFEEMECPDNPINSVSFTPTWYAINTDFYLVSERCQLDPMIIGNINALNQPVVAQDGVGFASLEAGLSTNGYFSSEGVGIELSENLEAGRFYYIEMQTIHYPEIEDLDYPDEGCEPIPTRYMSVYFGSDTIDIRPETIFDSSGILITGIHSNARLKLTDRAPDGALFNTNQWNEFWDCFQAEGTEEHMAIAGSFGMTTDRIDCIMDDQPGRLYFAGHAVDAVKLHQIPLSIDTSLYVCEAGITIALQNYIDGPFFEKAEFQWSDGSTETTRFLDQTGQYEIDMILPCVTVPITLEINEVTCRANIYLGNVFSPNADGINDRLIPSIRSPYHMIDYQFSIFNRGGQKVFSSLSPSDAWDGTIGGQNAPIGVYTWIIQYALDVGSNQEVRQVGDVMLVR